MAKPILCLDFDGVIHSYTSGWKGHGIANDPPTEGTKEFLLEAVKHFKIMIYSSRSKSIRGQICMRKYMKKHFDISTSFNNEYNFDFLYEAFSYPLFKPSAFITIDDRAIQFTGIWPNAKELLNFKPWNKR